MHYNLYFDYSTIVILLILLIAFSTIKKLPNGQSQVFIILLTVSFLSVVFDIITVYTIQSGPVWLFIAVNMVYYYVHTIIPFFFFQYIKAFTENCFFSIEKKKNLREVLPYRVLYLLITLTPWTRLLFYVDSEGMYRHGILFYFSYFVAFYYIAYGVIYVFVRRKLILKQIVKYIYLCALISAIPVIMQILFPTLLLECFAGSICLLLIFMTIQNYDDCTVFSTEMLNFPSFLSACMIYTKEKTVPHSLLVIKIDEFEILSQKFGVSYTKEFTGKFINFLNEQTRFGEGYYIEKNCYALMTSNLSHMNEIKLKIQERMEKTWTISSLETSLSVTMLYLEIPKDVDDVDIIYEYIECFTKSNYQRKVVLNVGDIHLKDKNRVMLVERAIWTALESGGLEVYYQPIYSVAEKRVAMAEALIRLYDKELGFIPPDEFIPIAERNGLILKVGDFVINSVCKFISEKQFEGSGIRFIHINLSVVQCMQMDLVSHVLNIIENHGIKSEQIYFEVTETASACTPEIMESNIMKLNGNGIKFALDDYGTGYSNLQIMLNLPFSVIKFDKNITWSIFKNPKNKVAIEGFIGMVKNIHLDTVAEGVETKEQAVELINMGFNYLQGYYFSKPVPKEEFLKYIQSDVCIGL